MRSTPATLLCLLGLPAVVQSKITISVSKVEALPLDTSGRVSSAGELVRRSCPEEFAAENPYAAELMLSSYSQLDGPKSKVLDGVYPSSDSFLRGVIVAWANHQSLVLRPDVVWFEILAQLNFYMTKNAESIRHLFVDFEGKRDIIVRELTLQRVVASFGTEIQKRVKTDWLLGWITPGFSTSTQNDNMTATVLMMGLMQHYFSFFGELLCGIPSVTLLGTRNDWAALYKKLDRLQEWGAEPTQYANKLRPILRRFVQTWDEPDSPATRSFWEQIVRTNRALSCGAQSYKISGWITGFMHWKESGSLRDPREEEERGTMKLDGVAYAPVGVGQIPVGYAKAPLTLLNYPRFGMNTTTYVLAGNVGVRRTVTGSKKVLAEPLNSWFVYGPVQSNFTTGPTYGDTREVPGLVTDPLQKWCPAPASW